MEEKLIQLNHELNNLYQLLNPTHYDLIIRKKTYLKIKSVLHKKYKIKMYGSSSDQLFTKQSDLDLVIITEEEPNFVLKDVKESLENSGKLNIKDNAIIHLSNARVPILKFVIAKYNLSVDISTNWGLILRNSKIIQKFYRKFPSLKKLFLILNFILKQRNLYKNGGINSTALKVLLIHFLNLHPLIQVNMIDLESNFGVLMIEFFQYFGFCFPSKFTITLKGFKGKTNCLYLSVEDPATNQELCYGCEKGKEIETLFKYLYRVMVYGLNSSGNERLLGYWIK